MSQANLAPREGAILRPDQVFVFFALDNISPWKINTQVEKNDSTNQILVNVNDLMKNIVNLSLKISNLDKIPWRVYAKSDPLPP